MRSRGSARRAKARSSPGGVWGKAPCLPSYESFFPRVGIKRSKKQIQHRGTEARRSKAREKEGIAFRSWGMMPSLAEDDLSEDGKVGALGFFLSVSLLRARKHARKSHMETERRGEARAGLWFCFDWVISGISRCDGGAMPSGIAPYRLVYLGIGVNLTSGANE